MTDFRTHVRNLLRVSGILPRKPRSGCPELPQIVVNGETWANRTEFMQAAEAAHDAGYGLAVLLAFQAHARFTPNEPLPDWVRRAIANGIDTWLHGYTDSLEESLGASRGNRKFRESSLRSQEFAGQMLIDARREIEAGARIDRELWHRIGIRYGVSAMTAERTVRASGVPLKRTGKIKRTPRRRAF